MTTTEGNGDGDGKGPPEKSARKEPTNDPSSNKDDQAQPATPAATETKRVNASGSDKRLGKYNGTIHVWKRFWLVSTDVSIPPMSEADVHVTVTWPFCAL